MRSLDAVLATVPFADGNDLMIPLHAAQIAEAAVAAGTRGGERGRPGRSTRTRAAVGLLATGHLCFGAVDRSRGDVARTLGRLDDAIECYERAIDIEEAVGARIYANRSRLGLALALAARDADGDRERVEFLAPAIIRVAEELGTPMVADAARCSFRSSPGPGGALAGPTISPPAWRLIGHARNRPAPALQRPAGGAWAAVPAALQSSARVPQARDPQYAQHHRNVA